MFWSDFVNFKFNKVLPIIVGNRIMITIKI
jgi:hypothetical protein